LQTLGDITTVAAHTTDDDHTIAWTIMVLVGQVMAE